jgi:hypothetical protein
MRLKGNGGEGFAVKATPFSKCLHACGNKKRGQAGRIRKSTLSYFLEPRAKFKSDIDRGSETHERLPCNLCYRA